MSCADDKVVVTIEVERLETKTLKRRLARFRTLVSFFLVGAAQQLSPAAAADPASRIDPPAWSQQHTRDELQAYGARIPAQEPAKKQKVVLKETRLRRFLKRQSEKH